MPTDHVTAAALSEREKRLEGLSRGFLDEAVRFRQAPCPLLAAERTAYLEAILHAAGAAEAARQALARALARITAEAC
jgi:hypothetical protein